MIEWLRSIGESLGPAANLLQVLGALLTGALFSWSFLRRRQVRQKKIQGHLESALVETRKEIDALTQDLDTQRQYDVQTWIDGAARERREGNAERAAAILRAGIDSGRNGWSEVCYQLARHCVTLFPTAGRLSAIIEAHRWAQVSFLLRPEQRDRAALMEEVNACLAIEKLRSQRSPQERVQGQLLPDIAAATDDSDPEALMASLIFRCWEHRDAGHYMIWERLAHRAYQLARSTLSEGDIDIDLARLRWAEALGMTGAVDEALTEYTAVFNAARPWSADDKRSLFPFRHEYARFLEATDREEAALREVEQALQDGTWLAADSPAAVLMKIQCVRILQKTGRADRVRPLLDELFSSMRALMETREDLRRSLLHAQAELLDHDGRSAEALEKIDAALKVASQHEDHENANVLGSRFLRARILAAHGLRETALSEIRAVIEIQTPMFGAENPIHTLKARLLEVDILYQLNRWADVIRTTDELLPIHRRIHGPRHSGLRQLIQQRCEAMIAVQRSAEALTEVDAALAQSGMGEDAEIFSRLQWLRALALYHLGRDEDGTQHAASLRARFPDTADQPRNLLGVQVAAVMMLNRLGRREEMLELIDKIAPSVAATFGADHWTSLTCSSFDLI